MNRMYSTIILGAGLTEFELEPSISEIRSNLIRMNILNHLSINKTILVLNTFLNQEYTKIVINENVKIIEVGYNKGALASAAIAASSLSDEDPILIVPMESFVDSHIIKDFMDKMHMEEMTSGCIVFKSKKSKFSYVRKGPGNEIVEIAEKRIIGDLATTGIFYFSSKRKFLEACSWTFTNNVTTNDKFYLAPSLNFFILTKDRIGYLEISEDQYFRFSDILETKETIKRLGKNE